MCMILLDSINKWDVHDSSWFNKFLVSLKYGPTYFLKVSNPDPEIAKLTDHQSIGLMEFWWLNGANLLGLIIMQ